MGIANELKNFKYENLTDAQKKASELRKRGKKPTGMILCEKMMNTYIISKNVEEITDELLKYRDRVYWQHKLYVCNDTLRKLIYDNSILKDLKESGVIFD